MSRPKPTREDAAAKEARIERYGYSDSDFTDAEVAQLRRDLEARFRLEASWDREARRRERAAAAAAVRPPSDGRTGE